MTDTIKHMWDQVEKARADGTFSTAPSPSYPVTERLPLSPEMVLTAAREVVTHLHSLNKPYSADVMADCILTIENLLSRPAAQRATESQIESGAKAIYINRSSLKPSLRISQAVCDEHFAWYHAGEDDPASCVHYSNVAYALRDARSCLASVVPSTDREAGK